VLKV
jgi:hypothetical protein